MGHSVPTAMTDLPDREEESGRWRPQFSDEDVLRAVKDADGLATSGDVHRALGCSYDTARRRLKELVEAGELETMEVAGTNVYSLPE